MDTDKVQVAFQTRRGQQVVRMTSTLVETVSINYEDFNESFLTCGTCLCTYDGGEHTPKLLPCSHTVCLHCLGRIAASTVPTTSYSTTPATASTSSASSSSTPRPENSTFRCPICRELIHVPRGGVAALPPSFLVNQLLDLMASQRREVIPKCSIHSNQELLFCESCDTVFCSACKINPHNVSVQSGSHNVIPFAVAIKRLSEILRSKVSECVIKLDEAECNITQEIDRLDSAENAACQVVEKAFEEAVRLLDMRRKSYIAQIKETASAKQQKLREQIELIEKEKDKVRESCDGLEYQVEVRHITKRISELSSQLDSFSSLRHPRENAYLLCKTQSDLTSLETAVLTDIHTSNTYPPLCTVAVNPGSLLCTGVEVDVILETRDYNNEARKVGGDPVTAKVAGPSGTLQESLTSIEDNEDGTYCIRFVPSEEGIFKVRVEIFGRPIREESYEIQISQHNNPLKIWGKGELCQPVSVARNDHGEIFLLDIGNARIVVLDQNINIKRVLENETLKGRSCTGIAYASNFENLVVVNWRTKEVSRLCPNTGETTSSFTYSAFEEPIGLCVDRKGNIFVADNGARSVFVFDTDGNFKYVIKRDKFSLLGGVAIGADDNTLIVADMSLYVVNGAGPQFDREITVAGKGRFGGICVDESGMIIACRTEKCRSFIQVFKDNKLVSTIDSFNSKLRRPSDIALISHKNIVVVDLGNECIKQYRYK